jgi:hypothetical protein
MTSQGLLFSEPLIAETVVWCCLTNGIDPAQWAQLCRFIGELNPNDFIQLKSKIMPNHRGLKTGTTQKIRTAVNIPLISIGPSGLGGRYQRESSP